MRKQNMFYCLAFLLICNSLKAQVQNDIYHFNYQIHNTTNNTYGASTEFSAANITSDYGKRHFAGSEWHKGVDFANGAPINRWDHFTSLNTGIIRKLRGEAGYKYIITEGSEPNRQHHFGYGHLFEYLAANPSYKRGDLILSKMDDVPFQYAIINFTEGSAFGPVQGTVTYDGVPYNVVTAISEGDVLGNIGKSRDNQINYTYMHVHVYMFENIEVAIGNQGQGGLSNHFNDRDALEFISHVNTLYDVAISTDDNVMGENVIVASGAETVGLKVRYSMQNANPVGSIFTNVVMDIDDVDLFIKESYLPEDAYQLILGEYVESHLSHGARLGSDIYPVTAAYGYLANPSDNTIINLINSTYGDFSNTGIDPYAYTTGNNQAYDDYYFSDFYTRVHDDYQLGGIHNFAAANCEAKYKDGKYQLFAKVTTVRGTEYTSIDNGGEPTEIVIDNFKPYIEKVIITQKWTIESFPVYVTVYNSVWDYEEGAPGSLIQSYLENKTFKASSETIFEITSSEPLEYCNLSLQPLSMPIGQTEVDDSHTIWKYNISDVNLPPPGFYNLNIVGKDLAGNYLQSNPTNIPMRQSNNENRSEWYPEPCPGPDKNHSFEISSCMLAFSFTPEIISVGEQTTVSITNLSSGFDEDNYVWHWSFGNASTVPVSSSEKNPPPIIFQDNNMPGTYKIQIQIEDDGQLVSQLQKYIQIIDPETYVLANFEAATVSENGELYGNSPLTVQFADLTTGNPDAWNWDFGDIIGSNSEQNPEYTFINSSYSPQQYNVTLEACNTTSNCAAEMKNAFITVYPKNSSLDPIANFTLTQSSLFAPCTVSLFNNSTGEIDTYAWDLDGDGYFDDSNLQNPPPQTFNESQYTSLSLKVKNTATQISDVHTVNLNVYANPNSGYTVDFSYSPNPAFQGALINFDEDITGFYYSYNCTWKIYGPGNYYHVSYLNNPSLSFFESGIYSVYLEAYDFYGSFLGVCSKQVTINPPGLTASPDEIEPSDFNHWGHFGRSVSMDGDFAVIAAPNRHEKGAIYIYKYNHLSEIWSLFQGPLLPDVHENDMFAVSLAISGNYIAVGAPYQSNGVERNGAVYIYEYNGSSWQLQANKLVPADATFNDGCGTDLAMDGNYLVVGTNGGVAFPDSLKNNPNNKDHAGKAYIYKNENGIWVEKQKIFDPDGYVDDGFGRIVSISGSKVAVSTDHKKVLIFQRGSDEVWSPTTISTIPVTDVSIYNNTLLVGSRNAYSSWVGTACIYEKTEGIWVGPYYLQGSTAEYSCFGQSVSVNGNYAIVGSPGEDNFDQEHSGASYIYRKSNDIWFLIEKVTPTFHPDIDYSNTSFGVEVFCGTSHIIIGRPGCQTVGIFDCQPSPPEDFPGAVAFLSNYMYPCDRSISEDNYHPSPGTYPDNSAGYITLGGNPAGEVYFQQNVNIAYYGSDILLLDGFTAAEGSNFVAKGMECAYLPLKGDNLPSHSSYQVANFEEENNFMDTGDIDTQVNNLKVYPNPSSGKITIDFAVDISDKLQVELVNIFGKSTTLEFFTNDCSLSIDLSLFSKGIYLVLIKTAEKIYAEKIILQK